MPVVHAQVKQAWEEDSSEGERPKKKLRLDENLRAQWAAFEADAALAKRNVEVADGGFAFHFVEGALIDAVRCGHWLLLDEINLAPPQVRVPLA